MCGGGAGGTSDPAPVAAIALVDLAQRLVVQRDLGGGHPTVDVTRQARPDDTRGDAGLRQHPCDREARKRRPEPVGDLPEPLDEGEVLREERLLERGRVAAPVVLVERRDPGAVVGAREHPGRERRVAEHADAVLLRPRHDGRESAPRTSSDSGGCTESTWRTAAQRSSCSTSKLETPIQRTFPSSTSAAIVPHDSSSCGARRPVGPVRLVQVDPLDAETAQASLALLADRLGAQVVPDRPLRTALPPAAALREDEDLLADPVRRGAHVRRPPPSARGRRPPRCRPSSRRARSRAGRRRPTRRRRPGPHPNRHGPPIAQAPKPTTLSSGPCRPRRLVLTRATAPARRGSRATCASAPSRAAARPWRVETAEASSRAVGRSSMRSAP